MPFRAPQAILRRQFVNVELVHLVSPGVCGGLLEALQHNRLVDHHLLVAYEHVNGRTHFLDDCVGGRRHGAEQIGKLLAGKT